ncbi:MAG: hypothetical protein WCK35_22575 [Chloroflexota bacterium]
MTVGKLKVGVTLGPGVSVRVGVIVMVEVTLGDSVRLGGTVSVGRGKGDGVSVGRIGIVVAVGFEGGSTWVAIFGRLQD